MMSEAELVEIARQVIVDRNEWIRVEAPAEYEAELAAAVVSALLPLMADWREAAR